MKGLFEKIISHYTTPDLIFSLLLCYRQDYISKYIINGIQKILHTAQ